MKRAAIGVQMHSGWGVLVAVSLEAKLITIHARRRIATADPEIAGSLQPYHHASRVELCEAEAYLARCTTASALLAQGAVNEVMRALNDDSCQVTGCAVLLASGRPLPPLAKILGAHPLIHTAEGEFFRHTVRNACESLEIPVTLLRERDLDQRAQAAWGKAASRVQETIANLGSAMGPPWTRDHKAAALAAALVLADQERLVSTE